MPCGLQRMADTTETLCCLLAYTVPVLKLDRYGGYSASRIQGVGRLCVGPCVCGGSRAHFRERAFR